MKNYKGYYIDHIYFHSKSDIDEFIKNQKIKHYKELCKYFNQHPSMETSIICSEVADQLHNHCNLTWDEIESLEIEAISA